MTEDLNRFRLRCPGPGPGADECDGAQMRTRAHARPLFHTRTGPSQVAIQGLALKALGCRSWKRLVSFGKGKTASLARTRAKLGVGCGGEPERYLCLSPQESLYAQVALVQDVQRGQRHT